MRKYILYLLPVFAVSVLSGCNQDKTETSEQVMNPSAKELAVEENAEEQKMNPVDSFKKMLSMGKRLECQYSMQTEVGSGLPTSVLMQMDGDKKYKMTMDNSQEGKNYVLSDGESLYFWSEKTKQGMKMDTKCMEEMKKKLDSDTGEGGVEPIDVTGYQYDSNSEALDDIPSIDCHENSADVDVSIPEGIMFTDQCKMMEQAAEMMKKNPGIPSDLMEKIKDQAGEVEVSPN